MQSIGNKILSAAKKMHPKGHHPRIIMTEADFVRLRENREVGAYKPLLDKMIADADKLLNAPVSEYVIPDGVRLLVTSRRVQERLMTLSFAYRITDEKKYLDRAVLEIEAACAFPDFHPNHFLDCAVMCNAFAYVYDRLYDVLDEETKALMRHTLFEKGFERIKIGRAHV